MKFELENTFIRRNLKLCVIKKSSMEATESPLDVLSRAATMVQDSTSSSFNESSSALHEDKRDSPAKEVTTRWRRDRRCKDRQMEVLSTAKSKLRKSDESPDRNSDSQLEDGEEKRRTRSSADGPLDMTTRRRASSPKPSSSPPRYQRSPPPYGAFHYTTTQQYQRPSVITCASGPKHCPKTKCPSPGYTGSSSPTRMQDKAGNQNSKEVRHGHRRELLSGMCDPVIDEHFRRSLGKDYINLFSGGSSSTTSSTSSSVTVTGLSVDDHFAKALGDTWVKLQAESKAKESKTERSEVSSCSTTSIHQQRRGLVST